MKKILLLFVLCLAPLVVCAAPVSDQACLVDSLALDRLQRDAFRHMWEDGDPSSGMTYEMHSTREGRTVAVGGTGFGVAAVVVAVDRGWIARDEAVDRLKTILTFLRDKTPRKALHGAFPHWLNGATGEIVAFSKQDTGADIVETALLMQGLLIARAYFNGPGVEETIRGAITELWEGVEWDWFANGEENGLYWHWAPSRGFAGSLKILGFNECHIAYVLALASPTHPISRKTYDYWTSGKGYQPKKLYGYDVQASLAGGGPLFLAQYSYVGLDPRRMADAFVTEGYFVRNVKHTLSNRGYCLQHAPIRNKYGEDVWGLTACQIKDGYAANEPARDSGTIAPTAALSSMPYTPHYSMQTLANLLGPLRARMWGKSGPFDAFSPRSGWFSNDYIAIDQLPIVCMVENYRTGLLWRLFMGDADVREGLKLAGIEEPRLSPGFPEAVVTLKKKGKTYVPDAYEIRRHPDSWLYEVPYWADKAGEVVFRFADADGKERRTVTANAVPGRNYLRFAQFAEPGEFFTVTASLGGHDRTLPVRLH